MYLMNTLINTMLILLSTLQKSKNYSTDLKRKVHMKKALLIKNTEQQQISKVEDRPHKTQDYADDIRHNCLNCRRTLL
jgi:hypothetical protein